MKVYTGSRILGHQVATDALITMEKTMKRNKIIVNYHHLACAQIASAEVQDYPKGLTTAENYVWVYCSSMAFLTH